MKILFRVLKHAGHLWPYYLTITALSLLVSGLTLLTPFLTKHATDILVQNAGFDAALPQLLWIIAGIIGAAFTVTLINNISGFLGDMMSTKLEKFMMESYYAHLLRLPQSYFDNTETGKGINRVTRAVGGVTGFLNYMANSFFKMILTIIVGIVIVATYNILLAIVLLAVYPIFLYLTAITSRKWQVWQKKNNTLRDKNFGRFAELFTQMKVVKSFGTQNREYSFLVGNFSKIIGTTREQSIYWHKMDIFRSIALNILIGAATGYIFILTLQGQLGVGDMVMLIQIVALISTPIFAMSFIIDAIQRAISGSEDYFAVLDEELVIEDAPNAKPLKMKDASITYKNVAFSYEEEKSGLENISFEVSAGKKVALVGESGQGKTTLTNLLLRFYDVREGEILVNGQNIATVTQQSLRQNIGVVFQEPALFSGTVRENIAYARPGASESELRAAAKSANALDFIEKLEKGFDTKIGERGVKLSGGQKQRIAIARAILKDAPILVLDEATSSLDNKSEHQVQEALDRLMKNRTTIIIAHRLSTIASVDMIVTLKNGTVDEIGSPAKLAKTNGVYAELLRFVGEHTEKSEKALKEFGISS